MWPSAAEVSYAWVPVQEDTALRGECSRVIKQPKSKDCTWLGSEVNDLNVASRFLFYFSVAKP